MSVIRTTPAKIGGLVRRRQKKSLAAARVGALSAAHRGKAMIGNHTPGDLGQLVLSWTVKDLGANSGDGIATLLNDAPHAGIVEEGARPHKVSSEGWWAIYEWVERHFPEASEEELGLDAYGHDPGFSRITWAIVKKIGRKGQKPTYFVRNKLPEFFAITHKEINRSFAKLASQGKL